MASFCRVDSLTCHLPSMLSALEEYDFLFQLHLNDMPQDDSNEVCVSVVCYDVGAHTHLDAHTHTFTHTLCGFLPEG